MTGGFNGAYDLYFGDSVYGDLETVADNRDNRYRFRDQDQDVLQLVSDAATSLQRAGLMVLGCKAAALGDIKTMSARFASAFVVSIVVEVEGRLYIAQSSRQRRGSDTETYALDLKNETWREYTPGALVNNANESFDLDFRFDTAKGDAVTLSPYDIVTKIGIAYETDAAGQGWNITTLVFEAKSAPASIGLIVASGGLVIPQPAVDTVEPSFDCI